MRKYIFFFILFSTIVQTSLWAQKITVNAKLDSTVLRIGDQTKLTFEVSQQPNQKVIMPVFSDTIVGGLEIVEPSKMDTIKSPDGHIIVNLNYLVTSFKDSLLYVPSYPFIIDNDTVWSKSLSLKVVQPFQIDTASNSITDIKPVFTPKFDWLALLKIILLVFVIIALIVIAIVLFRKYFQKKPVFERSKKDPDIAPYIVALSELERIKTEKLWQQGRSKEFHTQLTDVLRSYIESAFDINSMEMTSDEILQSLKTMQVEQKSTYTGLKQILQLADLAKFAKWNAMPDENELSLMNAFLFVNQTKKEEVKPLEEIKKQEGIQD
ncbi:MAG: hypothetical protein PHS59_15015 [Paludibacter sp.]|nr:hypothetical protein [Paludibacter sp.]